MNDYADTAKFDGEHVLFNVKLSSDEILHLDGVASPELQSAIDLVKNSRAIAARHDIPINWAIFIARVVRTANNDGSLAFYKKPITHCAVSGRRGEYVYHTSRGLRLQFPKQKTFSGVELKNSVVSIRDGVILGCDAEVFNLLRPYLAIELRDVVAEIPEKVTGYAARYRKEKILMHEACGWEGPDSETSVKGNFQLRSCPCCATTAYRVSTKFKDTGRTAIIPVGDLTPEDAEQAIGLPMAP